MLQPRSDTQHFFSQFVGQNLPYDPPQHDCAIKCNAITYSSPWNEQKHARLRQAFCTCRQHCLESSSPRKSGDSLSLHSNFAEIFRSSLMTLSKTDSLNVVLFLSFTYSYLKLYCIFICYWFYTHKHILFLIWEMTCWNVSSHI